MPAPGAVGRPVCGPWLGGISQASQVEAPRESPVCSRREPQRGCGEQGAHVTKTVTVRLLLSPGSCSGVGRGVARKPATTVPSPQACRLAPQAAPSCSRSTHAHLLLEAQTGLRGRGAEHSHPRRPQARGSRDPPGLPHLTFVASLWTPPSHLWARNAAL